MTRGDRKLLFTALAFFAVAGRNDPAERAEEANGIRKLASLAESFCEDHVFSASNAAGGQAIDEMIGRLIVELRDDEVTRLPAERATLIDLHDRLAARKARWLRRDFYEGVSDQTLADGVLALLDEEIDRMEKMT